MIGIIVADVPEGLLATVTVCLNDSVLVWLHWYDSSSGWLLHVHGCLVGPVLQLSNT